MDPQQRLLLETVFEGIESAGLIIRGFRGSDTAVYVGMMSGDDADLLNHDLDALPTYHGTGTSRAMLSNRMAYFRPARAVYDRDTACSSSARLSSKQ